MTKYWLLFLSLFLIQSGLHSQKYRSTIGIRLGEDIGISAQLRLFKHTTVEAILGPDHESHDLSLYLLGKRHFPIIGRGLNFYLGAGPFRQVAQNSESENRNGLALQAGVELRISRMVLGWDFLPAYHFQDVDQPLRYQTAVSLKYILIREKRNKRHWFGKRKR